MKFIFLAAAILLNSAGNILLKQASLAPAEGLGRYLQPLFVAGLACFGLNVLLYARALQDLPLHVAYPLLIGASLIAIVAASRLLFRAPVGLPELAGMALILAGASLLLRRAA